MRLTWLHYLTLTVLTANIAYGQNAPVFNSFPITTIDEDASYEYVIDVTDPNDDEVTLSISAGTTLPSGLTLGTTAPSKTVSTLAGSSTGSFMMGYFGGHKDGSAATSLFNGPGGVAIDASGNIFVADANNHCIRKIATDGTVSTFAGTVTGGFGTAGDVDGTGTAAKFNTPTDLTFDTNGYLYVTDKGNHKIKRISPTGEVSSFVGTGSPGSSNGFGTGASLNSPTAIVRAPNGLFYVADAGNHRIRRITSIGITGTLAGSSMGYNDATGTSAQFNQPEGIAVDSDGNVYVADTYNFRIRKITSSGVVTTIAGSGTNETTDGQGAAASFSQPTGIAVNEDGLIYVTDWLYGFVREIDASNNVTTIAGMSINDPMGSANTDGDALSATFYRPNRIALTSEGHLIIADGNQRIRQLTIDNGDPAIVGAVDVPGTYPIAITASDGTNTTDQTYNLVVTDILSVDSPAAISLAENSTGVLHTFTGSGPLAFTFSNTGGADADLFTIDANTGELTLVSGNLDFENPSDQYVNNTYEVKVTVNDGVNTGSQTLTINLTNVNEATPVLSSADVNTSVDENESVLYPISATDGDNDDITYAVASGSSLPTGLTLNQVDETYTVSLFSGDNLSSPGDVDGDASTSRYTFDASSKIIASKTTTDFLILQAGGMTMAPNVIRRVTADGNSSKLQDNNGATITLSGTGGIDMAPSGTIYVGDAGTNQIKQITSGGVVSIFSGSGSAFTFDGTSSTGSYQNIKDIAINSEGEIFVAQSTRIRKLDNTGAVTTVAGGSAMRADGTGSNAGFLDIIDIAFDQFDDMYILEASGYVRKMNKSYEVTSIAGGTTGSVDGTGTSAGFNTPTSLTVIPNGNLLIGENFKIREVTPEGVVTTFSGNTLGTTNGDIGVAAYGFPSGIASAEGGKIYLVDWYYHNIRELEYIPSSATITGAIATTGTYSFAISASDGELSTDQTFDLDVADVTTPVFTSGTTFDWDENESGVIFSAEATDPSSLTYDFDGSGVDNSLFSIDAATGEVSFQSAPDFENPLDNDMDNVYEIGVTATDGTNTATSTIIITVNDVTPSETLTITASDYTRTYGQSNPRFSTSIDGDISSGYTTVISTSADVSSLPGSYEINVDLILTGRDLDTYNLNTISGTLTIEKAPLSVTADDQTKSYGEANPELTLSYSGFVNGEDEQSLNTAPSATTVANTTSDAGTYDITVANGVSDNYTISYTNGSLTVNKANLFATINDQTKVYGETNPNFTVTYSGFVNGEDENVLDSPPTLIAYHPVEETFVDETSGVRDDYVINSTAGLDNNYSFNWTLGTLTITKAPLSVIPQDLSKSYGASNPALEQSITGFVNGEDEADLSTVPTLSTSADASSVAGTYDITSSGGEADNYSFDYINGTLTIEKAILAIVAGDASKVYGEVNPSFSQSITGFVNGEGQSDLTTVPVLATTADETSSVGTYDITPSGGEADNYAFDYTNGSLTIAQATLSVSADDASKVYGAANPTFSQTITGFVNGEDESDLTTVPVLATTANETSSVGTYDITPSGGEADNYAFDYTNGSLTIAQATLNVTADDASKVYGAANPTFSQTITGFVNGEDESDLATVPVLATTADETSSVGNYDITPSGGEADNYAFDYTNGSLTIAQATLTVTADDASKVYGAANPNLSQTITGFVNGEDESDLTTVPVLATTADETSSVGTYDISSSGGEADNYAFDYTNGSLTIAQATLSVSADDASKVYGAANPTFSQTITGFVNGEDESDLTTVPVLATTADETSSVGTYDITPSGGEADNYAFDYTHGYLTIAQATLTVTADDASKVYGAANPNFSQTITGFVDGEGESDLTTVPLLATTADETSSVGTYDITPSGGEADNYAFDYTNGSLTIAQATLTVTADDASKVYGAANPNLSQTITGFVNGEDESDLTTVPVLATTADETSSVGTYDITSSGGEDDNYAFDYNNGTLTIAQATLSVSADDASKVYGAANPTFSQTITGFVNGEDESDLTTVPVLATTADETSSVGTYDITPSGGEADNYAFDYTHGSLTIAQATLTVTADDASKVYGAANPNFSQTITGFVDGEGESDLTTVPLLATTADETSSVGTYDITSSGGEDDNYAFEYTGGTLTIGKALLTVTATNQSRVYGGNNPTLGVSISGYVNNDQATDLTTAPIASTRATEDSDVGTYRIDAFGGNDENYRFSYVNGTLTVSKASLAVFANDQIINKGDELPELTFEISGFVNNDVFADLELPPVASVPEGANETPGEYEITLSGGTDNNYRFEFTSGTLLVEAGEVLNTTPEVIELEVYPNPVSDWLNISGLKRFSNTAYYLIDLNGKRIHLQSSDHGSETNLDLRQIGSGMYLLMVLNEGKVLLKQKIMVTK